jgi:hypothetical protein
LVSDLKLVRNKAVKLPGAGDEFAVEPPPLGAGLGDCGSGALVFGAAFFSVLIRGTSG